MTSVSTSAFYDRANLSMSALRRRTEDLQSEIGSGERLTRSSDDPVAASRLRSLSRATSLARIDSFNAGRASSDLALTDDALTAFGDYIVRAQELATQAANGTLTASQRAAIGSELRQIHGSLIVLANTRDGDGNPLFGGESSGTAYPLDASGNPVYAGTAAAGELDLGDGQTITRGVTGPQVLSFGGTDLFAVVKGLADALQGGSSDPAGAARTALDGLSQGLDSVSTAQTIVGSRLAWIELTSERRVNADEARSSEQADLGGTDIAATVTQLQQAMTVLEASQASFAKLSGLSLFNALR